MLTRSQEICDSEELSEAMAPEKYKDVVAVSEDLEEAGAAEIIAWCSPRIVYRVRDEREDTAGSGVREQRGNTTGSGVREYRGSMEGYESWG
jgi:hypothetical protein